MTKHCPLCDAHMEEWSEPDQWGNVWTFWRCSKCGCKAGSADAPVPLAELKERLTA